jgi:hypothetical protein
MKRTVAVSAKCDEPCTVSAKARITLGLASRSFRTRAVRQALGAAKASELRLRFSRRAVRAVRRALKRKQRVVAEVTAHSRDLAGNSSTAGRSIRIRP